MPIGQHRTKLKAKELDAFSHVGRIIHMAAAIGSKPRLLQLETMDSPLFYTSSESTFKADTFGAI